MFSLVVGLPLGTVAAVKRGIKSASLIMAIAFIGYATPNFILTIFFILIFSFNLHWLPSSGQETWLHFVMPVLALGFAMMASVVRFSRSAILDVLGSDYIRTAYAKGLSEIIVIFKHALRNASIPTVSVVGLQVAGFVGAVVLVEAVFSLRGIGELVVRAAIQRDYPVVMGTLFVFTLIGLLTKLITDIMYVYVDPRIKFTSSSTQRNQ